MLELYGHPFSSYTWKALIPLYANGTEFTFKMVDPGHPDNSAFVAGASPQGKFPVLVDGGQTLFETTSIIDHLDAHYPGTHRFVPADPDAGIAVRTMDRVFDHYVMNIMTDVVMEYIGNPDGPDLRRIDAVKARLRRSYAWIEGWLAGYPQTDWISLVECAAAPALFYADWIERIEPGGYSRLAAWRAHLLALPAVKRCVDEARPYRSFFPPGAPDRD